MVELLAADGSVAGSTVTSDGVYRFSGLAGGEYSVRIPAAEFAGGNLAGYVAAAGGAIDPDDNADDGAGHNGTNGTGGPATGGVVTAPITLSATMDATGALTGDEPADNGFTNPTLDIALAGTGVIGDVVFYDVNGDGIQDPGEDGVPDATVTITWLGPDGVPGGDDDLTYPPATTGPNGEYLFESLPEGEYTVAVDGLDPSFVPSFDPDSGTTNPDNICAVRLDPGQGRRDVDFGVTIPFTLGDRIWVDLNGDGIYDPGDLAVPDGTVVELLAPDGKVLATTGTTNGLYRFTGLAGGEYSVRIPAAEFAGGKLAGYVAVPGGAIDPDDNADDGAGHNGTNGTGGPATGGVVTGPITLSATVDATGAVTGDEPADGGFTNPTLDIALGGPVRIQIDKEVCPHEVTCTVDSPLAQGGWVESARFPVQAPVEWRITVRNTGLQGLTGVVVTDGLVGGCTAPSFGDLAIGAARTYTCRSEQILAPINPNTVSVSGRGIVDGREVTDEDTASALITGVDTDIEGSGTGDPGGHPEGRRHGRRGRRGRRRRGRDGGTSIGGGPLSTTGAANLAILVRLAALLLLAGLVLAFAGSRRRV